MGKLIEGACFLYYLYFLEQKYLDRYLERLEQSERQRGTPVVFYGIYVRNTLLWKHLVEIDEEWNEQRPSVFNRLIRWKKPIDEPLYWISDGATAITKRGIC